MYEKFTDRARKVMQLANLIAVETQAEAIDTEHELWGLLEEGSGVGAHVLKMQKVDIEAMKEMTTGGAKRRKARKNEPRLPHSIAAKKAIEYAIEQARSFDHNYVGTEHLLLGLIKSGDGKAAHLLKDAGVEFDATRDLVAQVLAPSDPESPDPREGKSQEYLSGFVEGMKFAIQAGNRGRHIQKIVAKITFDDGSKETFEADAKQA